MNKKKFIILILALILVITIPFVVTRMQDEQSLKVDKGKEKEFFSSEEGKASDSNKKTVKFKKEKNGNLTMQAVLGVNALSSGKKKIKFNYKKAKKVNKSCLGAIYVPGTQIMQPIVKAKNNNYYLGHTFYKHKSIRGAIFMDCNLSFKDRHTMIYGHNLQSNDMFSQLKSYNKDSFAKKHQTVIIWIKSKKHTYKVFSSYISPPQSKQTYRLNYPNRRAYSAWLKGIKKKSTYKYKYKPKKNRNTITLSTCSTSSSRQVVHLQRIK